jgi:hypothetical protein
MNEFQLCTLEQTALAKVKRNVCTTLRNVAQVNVGRISHIVSSRWN